MIQVSHMAPDNPDTIRPPPAMADTAVIPAGRITMPKW